MSIFKVNHKQYVVWDNSGNYARFIGTLIQCRYYIKDYE